MFVVERIKTLYKRRLIFLLLAVNVLFIASVILFLPFKYESPDDRIMAWVTSGYISGKPDFHTLYMNVIYSWMESRLYSLIPSVEWHTWLLLLIHFIGLIVMVHGILKLGHNRVEKISIIAFLYLFEVYLITNLQFTTTAGLAATAGMLQVISRKKYGLGVFLFLLGSLVRFHSAMLCGLMTAALYPLIIIRRRFDKRQLVILGICAIGAIGFHFINNIVYQNDPEWKEIYDYDKLRAQVHDSPDFWRVYSHPPKGMTKKDFDNWVGVIEYRDVMTTEKLYSCLDVIDEETCYWGIPGLKKAKNIPSGLLPFYPYFFILGLLIIGSLFDCKSNKERWALVIGTMILPLSLAVVAMNTRMVEHAFLSGWMPTVFLTCYVFEFRNRFSLTSLMIALVSTYAFFAWKKIPTESEKPSVSFLQQQELVTCGEEYGAKCLVIDFYSGISEYPFGLRYHFNHNEIKVKGLRDVSSEMVDDKNVVFLMDRKACVSLIDGISRLFIMENGCPRNIISREICGNKSHSLFKIESE